MASSNRNSTKRLSFEFQITSQTIETKVVKIVVLEEKRIDRRERHGENGRCRIEIAVEHHGFGLFLFMYILYEVFHLHHNVFKHFFIHVYSSFPFDTITNIRFGLSETTRKFTSFLKELEGLIGVSHFIPISIIQILQIAILYTMIVKLFLLHILLSVGPNILEILRSQIQIALSMPLPILIFPIVLQQAREIVFLSLSIELSIIKLAFISHVSHWIIQLSISMVFIIPEFAFIEKPAMPIALFSASPSNPHTELALVQHRKRVRTVFSLVLLRKLHAQMQFATDIVLVVRPIAIVDDPTSLHVVHRHTDGLDFVPLLDHIRDHLVLVRLQISPNSVQEVFGLRFYAAQAVRPLSVVVVREERRDELLMSPIRSLLREKAG